MNNVTIISSTFTVSAPLSSQNKAAITTQSLPAQEALLIKPSNKPGIVYYKYWLEMLKFLNCKSL